MTTSAQRKRWRWDWLLLPAIVAAVSWCAQPQPSPGALGHPTSSLPECPHDWAAYLRTRVDSVGRVVDSLRNGSTLALAGDLTNVPEFHDCQEFVVKRDGQLVYDSLYAIFGAWDMQRRWRTLEATAAKGSITGYVEILAWGTYDSLGIKPGFNCVYLYRLDSTERNRYEARIVNYGHGVEPDCTQPASLADSTEHSWKTLQVKRDSFPGLNAADYPAAARWEWDPRDSLQYFGVACGAAWCEISADTMHLASQLQVPVEVPMNGAGHPWRVYRVRGWFDQQQLMASDAAAPAKAPSGAWGIIAPDHALDGKSKDAFAGHWVRTGYIAVSGDLAGYGQKFNLILTNTHAQAEMAQLELCWSATGQCNDSPGHLSAVPDTLLNRVQNTGCEPGHDATDELSVDKGAWWERITSRGKSTYYCVVRRDHSNITDPQLRPLLLRGMVRWRWRAHDEGIWQSCSMGCCEVSGFTE